MQILTTTGGTQTLKIIPRTYIEDVTVEVTNRNTKVTATAISATTTFVQGYQHIDAVFSLLEGTFYTFEVFSNTELSTGTLLYRGQIFCTDQTDYDNYEMNEGGYVTSDDKDDSVIIF